MKHDDRHHAPSPPLDRGRADEPERPVGPRERLGVAPHQLERPPQAEGDRENEEDESVTPREEMGNAGEQDEARSRE